MAELDSSERRGKTCDGNVYNIVVLAKGIERYVVRLNGMVGGKTLYFGKAPSKKFFEDTLYFLQF